MPEQLRYVERLARAYLSKKTKHRRLSVDNAERYLPIIMRMATTLSNAGLHTTPTKMGEPEIECLLAYYGELDTDTQRWMFSILSGFLDFYGNTVYKDMMITWPAETRTNVDWLTPEEAIRMLDAAQGIERIVIHMELRLWLRRCEVRRLKLDSIRELMDSMEPDLEGIVQVHGKGRGGGKWRTLAWAPETGQEVGYYLSLREEMAASAKHYYETSWRTGKRKRPQEPFKEPEDFLIYQKGKRVKGYSDSGLDSIVERVARRAGIARKIGNHTLRRTGARLAYFADVKLVEIMEALGHTSEKQTIRYLGITVAEQGKAQRKVYDYLEMIRARMELGQGEVVVSNAELMQKSPPKKMRVAR
ncbi:MAG: tyrosine-type recombinase/integrase [Methanomassiliicoccus sp.]|nr:tyrosine-type recombinase/integrase [Methanomassiliicoccus sp.]